MLQRALAWLVGLGLAGLVVVGVVKQGLWGAPAWSPEGLLKLFALAGGYGVFSLVVISLWPGWFIPLLGAAVWIYSSFAVGPVAAPAIGYLIFSCYAVGSLWFRRFPEFSGKSPQLTVLTGMGTLTAMVMLTAGLPVHYRLVYWLFPLPVIVYALRNQYLPPFRFGWTKDRKDVSVMAVGLFPLVCQWLVALKPEVSADGLAMHAVVASRMAQAHRWPFDVNEYIWAVMPMGGDWWFSIGWQLAGEAGAKLLNLATLGVIVWTLYERIHARVPNWVTSALVAAYVSTPLTLQVTGSLFVENVVAAFLLGACLLVRVYVKERRGVFLYAACFLGGMAGASKFGALAFLAPLLLGLVFQVKFRHLAIGYPVALVTAGVPYFVAWLRTSNPVFPFFNAVFHSPFYTSAVNFKDGRFLTPLRWTTWYDLTFHSKQFIEGWDGSFGFFFFVMLPLSVVGLRRRWPKTGFLLLWVSVAGMVLTYLGQSNLRYLYPALPLLTLLGAIALASYRTHSPALGVVLGGLAGVTVVLNLAVFPAAGSLHRDLYLNQFDKGSAVRYVEATAPEKRLVEYLNEKAPGTTAGWLEGNAVGDFRGRAYTNSWHSDLFQRRMREATAPEGLAWLAQDLRVKYFLAPAAESGRQLTNVYSREFLAVFTKPVATAGWMELRQWSPPEAGEASRLPYAGPGRYDDGHVTVRYAGAWTRDLQFGQSYQGSLVYTNDTRSRLVVRFRGSAVRLIYTAAANRCVGLVSIDEGEEREFSEHAAATKWQAESEPFRAAGAGEHLLQLRFPQTKAKAAVGACFLDLDGFVVEP